MQILSFVYEGPMHTTWTPHVGHIEGWGVETHGGADGDIAWAAGTALREGHSEALHAIRGTAAGGILVPPAGGLPQQCHWRGAPPTLL